MKTTKRPRIAKNYAAKNNGGYSHDNGKVAFDNDEKWRGGGRKKE